MSFALACGQFLAGRGELGSRRVQFVLCFVYCDGRSTQHLGRFIEIALGLGDLLLDPRPVRREFVGGSLWPEQDKGERRRDRNGNCRAHGTRAGEICR
jgi:hypothetical protein